MREGSRSRSEHLNRKMPARGKMRERPRGKEPVTLSTNQIDGGYGPETRICISGLAAHLFSFDAASVMSKQEQRRGTERERRERKQKKRGEERCGVRA